MNKPKKKIIYNKNEIGKCGTHAIASNQNYGYNKACDDWEAYYDWDIKENYIRKDKRFAQGFKAGQESIKRKNQSGCCCIVDDYDGVVSVCGAHLNWHEDKLPSEDEIVEILSKSPSLNQDIEGIDQQRKLAKAIHNLTKEQ